MKAFARGLSFTGAVMCASMSSAFFIQGAIGVGVLELVLGIACATICFLIQEEK